MTLERLFIFLRDTVEISQILQILGGYGYTKDFPVERYYRTLSCVQLVKVQLRFRN